MSFPLFFCNNARPTEVWMYVTTADKISVNSDAHTINKEKKHGKGNNKGGTPHLEVRLRSWKLVRTVQKQKKRKKPRKKKLPAITWHVARTDVGCWQQKETQRHQWMNEDLPCPWRARRHTRRQQRCLRATRPLQQSAACPTGTGCITIKKSFTAELHIPQTHPNWNYHQRMAYM